MVRKKRHRQTGIARARYVLRRLSEQFFLADNDLPVSLRLLLILLLALGFGLLGDLLNLGSWLLPPFAALF